MKSNRNLALLGFFILSYLLYRRLLIVRLPRDILPARDLFIIGVNAFLCISTFVIACVYLYTFFTHPSNKEKTVNPFLKKIIERYRSKWNPILLIQNSLLALDIYIKNNSPMYDENRDYVDLIVIFISKIICKYQRIFLFLFIFIPIFFQSIVTISFCFDVLINKKFYYFYKTLWLLIFPLIATYILHSIRALVDTNLKSLENVLTLRVVLACEYEVHKMRAPIFKVSVQDWKDIAANTPAGSYLCMNSLSQEFIENKDDLDHIATLNYCVDSMNEYFIIYKFLDAFALLKNKYQLPFNIIKYFTYSFCWGYIVSILLELF